MRYPKTNLREYHWSGGFSLGFSFWLLVIRQDKFHQFAGALFNFEFDFIRPTVEHALWDNGSKSNEKSSRCGDQPQRDFRRMRSYR